MNTVNTLSDGSSQLKRDIQRRKRMKQLKTFRSDKNDVVSEAQRLYDMGVSAIQVIDEQIGKLTTLKEKKPVEEDKLKIIELLDQLEKSRNTALKYLGLMEQKLKHITKIGDSVEGCLLGINKRNPVNIEVSPVENTRS